MNIQSFNIAKRMSWAAERKTTRPEDTAYSLLGLFDINMPLQYGEGGPKAFHRLQEEILKSSPDDSMLAYDPGANPFWDDALFVGPFASAPSEFKAGAQILVAPRERDALAMTHLGLRVKLPLLSVECTRATSIAVLENCFYETNLDAPIGFEVRGAIFTGDENRILFHRRNSKLVIVPQSELNKKRAYKYVYLCPSIPKSALDARVGGYLNFSFRFETTFVNMELEWQDRFTLRPRPIGHWQPLSNSLYLTDDELKHHGARVLLSYKEGKVQKPLLEFVGDGDVWENVRLVRPSSKAHRKGKKGSKHVRVRFLGHWLYVRVTHPTRAFETSDEFISKIKLKIGPLVPTVDEPR